MPNRVDDPGARFRMLRQHPEVYRQFPIGVTVESFHRDESHRKHWTAVVDFLRSCGLVRSSTMPLDVDVPKLVAAIREDEPVIVACPKCGFEQEDHDGFGVVYCPKCSYCTHASMTGDVCGICGKKVGTDGQTKEQQQ